MMILTDDDFELSARFKIRAMGDKLHGDHRRRILRPRGVRGENQTHARTLETEARGARKIARLIRQARFKYKDACVEDIEHPPERKPGRDRIERLASCQWVRDRETLIIIPGTGSGKSYISQALGNAACRRGIPTRYARTQDMPRGNRPRPARRPGRLLQEGRRIQEHRPAGPGRFPGHAGRRGGQHPHLPGSWRHAARPAPRPAPANANPSNGT